MELLIPILAIAILFLGLPWLILHYVTRWKQASTLTLEDENLLDELHDLARSLDDRMLSIERIIAADRGQPPLTHAIGARDIPTQISELPRQALRKER